MKPPPPATKINLSFMRVPLYGCYQMLLEEGDCRNDAGNEWPAFCVIRGFVEELVTTSHFNTTTLPDQAIGSNRYSRHNPFQWWLAMSHVACRHQFLDTVLGHR